MRPEHFFEELRNMGVANNDYAEWLEKNERIICPRTEEGLSETVELYGDRYLEELIHSGKCKKEAEYEN